MGDLSHDCLLRALAGAILGISFAFQAACSIEATAQEASAGSMNSGACSGDGAAFDGPLSIPHWNDWGVDPSQHRFQPSDMARLTESDLSHLKLKWAFGFPGATRSVAQPTVVGGRLFVGSQGGKVYSLDARSGCTIWEFGAIKGVRSAIVIGQRTGGLDCVFRRRGREHIFS
jgi:polyvinyl alcohol dehydrogenase (cytochrome)